ncbi:MAG: hypothetical protein KF804_02520 [Burkholderiales bacterium]|nr:hypothetical protein [Burkholderiales bacterium]
MGLDAGEGRRRVDGAVRALHHRHHDPVRIGDVVEVCAHVLQARGRLREEDNQG